MIGEVPVKRVRLGVLKVRSGMAAEGVIVVRQVLGFNVHWLLNRSYMCPGEGCAACFAGVGARWNGFLVVRVDLGNAQELRLLELSATGFERLAGLVRMEGWPDLAGVRFRAARSRAKGVLLVEPVARDESLAGKVVSEIRAWEPVATLYGLPSPMEEESLALWEFRARGAAAALVAIATEVQSRQQA